MLGETKSAPRELKWDLIDLSVSQGNFFVPVPRDLGPASQGVEVRSEEDLRALFGYLESAFVKVSSVPFFL